MVKKITVPKIMRKISEMGDADSVHTYSRKACLFWKRSRSCSCCLFRAISQKGCDPFWNFEVEASKSCNCHSMRPMRFESLNVYRGERLKSLIMLEDKEFHLNLTFVTTVHVMFVTGENLCQSALSKPRISNIDQWRTSAGKGIHAAGIDLTRE